jgi:hypothetical protein
MASVETLPSVAELAVSGSDAVHCGTYKAPPPTTNAHTPNPDKNEPELGSASLRQRRTHTERKDLPSAASGPRFLVDSVSILYYLFP